MNRCLRNRIHRVICLALAWFMMLAPVCVAEPAFADGVSKRESVSTGTEEPSYSAELLEWASEKAKWLEKRYQDSIEEVNQLREKQEAQNYVHAALLREILSSYDIFCNIPEDAPWLVRVNQTTCTVTVYRLVQVPRDQVPFGKGFDTVVEEALEEAKRAAEQEKAEREKAEQEKAAQAAEQAQQTGESQENKNQQNVDRADGTQASDAQEQTVLREFQHIVLRQFRQTKASEGKSIQNVTLMLPVYACPCSIGAEGKTPTGTFTVYSHLRWHELVGPTWGQWCCHFAPSFLFHSLPYDRPNDPNSLQKDVYNQLGTAASHGCVRLAAIDAKYIYDHIPSGGKVEIFYGTEADDPLGKPERPFVGEWEETYDPTDPEFRPE